MGLKRNKMLYSTAQKSHAKKSYILTYTEVFLLKKQKKQHYNVQYTVINKGDIWCDDPLGFFCFFS